MAKSGPRARLQVLQNSLRGSRMFMLQVKTLSARVRHSESRECSNIKNYRECSNIWRARVSAMTGSVPCKMAKGQQRFSAPYWNRSPVARLKATLLNHWAVGLYRSAKVRVYDSSYLATLNRFLACRIVVLGLLSLNIRPDTIYQNSWTHTFYRYILSHWT